MPPKGKQQAPSKKAEQKKKEKVIEVRTLYIFLMYIDFPFNLISLPLFLLTGYTCNTIIICQTIQSWMNHILNIITEEHECLYKDKQCVIYSLDIMRLETYA